VQGVPSGPRSCRILGTHGSSRGLLTRRSVRKFTREPVTRAQVLEILRALVGPLRLNNQPWRFAIVFDDAARVRWRS